jgi:quercetin dioxygenase-like cupin family protein
MEIENQEEFIMQKEDLYVMKKGINHRVSSKEECLIMLIESKTTEHTGEITTAITKTIRDQFY